MKEKILLITAPFYDPSCPRYSTAYILGLIEGCGWDCDILDLNIELFHKVPQEYKYLWLPAKSEQLKREDDNILRFSGFLCSILDKKLLSPYTIVAFTVDDRSFKATQLLTKYVKKNYPALFILAGGPSVFKKARSNKGIALLKAGVDLIFQGEAEQSLPLFFQSFEKTRSIPCGMEGLLYTFNNETIDTGEPAPVNINNYRFPINWRKFDLSKYTVKNQFYSALSRGCPHSCVFCTETITTGRYRKRDISLVISDIKNIIQQLKDPGIIPFINFSDSLINGSLSHLTEFCEEIVKLNLKIKWGSMASISPRIPKNLFTLMKKSGCCSLAWGVETGSAKVGKSINKNPDPTVVLDVLRDSYDCGIDNVCMIMTGFIGEGPSEFVETLVFMWKHKAIATFFTPNPLMIFESSSLYKKAKQQGYNVNDCIRWSSSDGLNTYEIRYLRERIGMLVLNLDLSLPPFVTCFNEIDLNTTVVSRELLLILFALWKATDQSISFILDPIFFPPSSVEDYNIQYWDSLEKNSSNFHFFLFSTLKLYLNNLK